MVVILMTPHTQRAMIRCNWVNVLSLKYDGFAKRVRGVAIRSLILTGLGLFVSQKISAKPGVWREIDASLANLWAAPLFLRQYLQSTHVPILKG